MRAITKVILCMTANLLVKRICSYYNNIIQQLFSLFQVCTLYEILVQQKVKSKYLYVVQIRCICYRSSSGTKTYSTLPCKDNTHIILKLHMHIQRYALCLNNYGLTSITQFWYVNSSRTIWDLIWSTYWLTHICSRSGVFGTVVSNSEHNIGWFRN